MIVDKLAAFTSEQMIVPQTPARLYTSSIQLPLHFLPTASSTLPPHSFLYTSPHGLVVIMLTQST
jgi:hypothetical protein